eukprot:364374-Chlamydomonas_euryale.AAC.7
MLGFQPLIVNTAGMVCSFAVNSRGDTAHASQAAHADLRLVPLKFMHYLLGAILQQGCQPWAAAQLNHQSAVTRVTCGPAPRCPHDQELHWTTLAAAALR